MLCAEPIFKKAGPVRQINAAKLIRRTDLAKSCTDLAIKICSLIFIDFDHVLLYQNTIFTPILSSIHTKAFLVIEKVRYG